MSDNKRMGSSSVDTVCAGIRFPDGSYQTTAATTNTQANSLQCGVAIFTSGSTSTVTFANPYVATASPAVVCTALDGAVSGEPSSVRVLGSNNNWTGFSLTLSSSIFGAYNWIALGNPN